MSAHRRGTLQCLLLQTKHIPGQKKREEKKYAYSGNRVFYLLQISTVCIKILQFGGILSYNHHIAFFPIFLLTLRSNWSDSVFHKRNTSVARGSDLRETFLRTKTILRFFFF